MVSAHLTQFTSDFFPDLHALVQEHLVPVLEATLNAPFISCSHPEPRMDVTLGGSTFTLRNYTLLPIQIGGVLSGLFGALILHRVASQLGHRQARSKADARSLRSFAWGFLFFAGMNLTSIVCHNLSERLTPLWQIARMLDLVFTGASSASLAVAPLSPPNVLHPRMFALLLLFTALGDYQTRTIPFTAELVYIGMMIVAALVLAPRLHHFGHAKSRRPVAYFLSLLGVGIILASIPCDRWLCAAFGAQFTAVHGVFLGCDIAFVGMLWHVVGGVGLSEVLAEEKDVKKPVENKAKSQ